MTWTFIENPTTAAVEAISKALNVSDAVARLLVGRGIETFEQARKFFRPTLDALHNPMLMADMDKAVTRINTAITEGETILVYGDYDADGVTSIAMMTSFLKMLQAQVFWYCPDRYAEGYGVSRQGIDFAKGKGASLIIALDCGIRNADKVEYAQSLGIDFIICDHHLPAEDLPKAAAVLDPKRQDCNYPYKDLCGCGVGFKLIQALAASRNIDTETIYPYLDLVVTAISADIVPITGENRVLAYYGLKIMNSKPRPGIKALFSEPNREVCVSDIVFKISPKLNAAGRIEHASKAIELLLEEDTVRAGERAKRLTLVNQDRKDLDQKTTQEALEQIENTGDTENASTVVYDPSWNKGVIGIVASRLIEVYYRPTLVFTKSGDYLSASGRSIKGFDIHNALESCADDLVQFGGHTHAVGLSIREADYQKFKQNFENVVKTTLKARDKTPQIAIDMELSFAEITPVFVKILKQFAPFGPHNDNPVFVARGVRDLGYAKTVGTCNEHLRMHLTDSSENKFSAIGFGLGKYYEYIKGGNPFQIAYSIEENTWNGHTQIQLRVRDIKPMDEIERYKS